MYLGHIVKKGLDKSGWRLHNNPPGLPKRATGKEFIIKLSERLHELDKVLRRKIFRTEELQTI